ncbi:MAG: hypothetical protein H0T62_10660 [Parachlamydiaceae bacterium]|nr:hypothetical protein [Parachlamydiaceae bacterium]
MRQSIGLYSKVGSTNQVDRKKWFIENNRFINMHPPKLFELIADASSPTGYIRDKIIIKKGAIPNDALQSAQRGLALLECASVCQIGQYQALLKVLGLSKFNMLFSRENGLPLQLSSYDLNPLLFFLNPGEQSLGVKGNRPVHVGQLINIRNVPEYSLKHGVLGIAGSFNVICNDATPERQTFVGLGLPSEGVTEQQIEQILIDENNAQPKDPDCMTDGIAAKIIPGGKVAWKNRNAYFDSTSDKMEKFNPSLLQSYNPNIDVEKQMEELKNLAIPLSLDTIKEKEFGYIPENSSDFNIEIIQVMIKIPLNNFFKFTKSLAEKWEMITSESQKK